jgi:hypothetical protein
VITVIASNSAPQRSDVAVAAADRVEEEFLGLVCADEELLRAEFDALIAATWGQPHPARPRRAGWPTPPPRRRPRPEFARPGPMRAPHYPGAEGRTRQRAPPGPHQHPGTTLSGSRKAVMPQRERPVQVTPRRPAPCRQDQPADSLTGSSPRHRDAGPTPEGSRQRRAARVISDLRRYLQRWCSRRRPCGRTTRPITIRPSTMTSANQRAHYAILGVDPDATDAQIIRAHRVLLPPPHWTTLTDGDRRAAGRVCDPVPALVERGWAADHRGRSRGAPRRATSLAIDVFTVP